MFCFCAAQTGKHLSGVQNVVNNNRQPLCPLQQMSCMQANEETLYKMGVIFSSSYSLGLHSSPVLNKGVSVIARCQQDQARFPAANKEWTREGGTAMRELTVYSQSKFIITFILVLFNCIAVTSNFILFYGPVMRRLIYLFYFSGAGICLGAT